MVAAYYNGGYYNAKDALGGAAPRSKETQNYVAGVDATLGATPMPAGPNSSGSPDDRPAGPNRWRGHDPSGRQGRKPRGSTVLRPYAAKPPSGAAVTGGTSQGVAVMTVKVFDPKCSVILKKNIGRANVAGNVAASQRFQGTARQIDLTPYLGDTGSVVVSKSVRQPAGMFSMTLADNLAPGEMESLYGIIEPMDVVRFAGAGYLALRRRLHQQHADHDAGVRHRNTPQRSVGRGTGPCGAS